MAERGGTADQAVQAAGQADYMLRFATRGPPTRWRDDAAMADRDRVEASGEELTLAFLQECAERLTARVAAPGAAQGATAFTQALARSTPLTFEPRWLTTLDTLQLVDPTPLGRRFVDVAPL